MKPERLLLDLLIGLILVVAGAAAYRYLPRLWSRFLDWMDGKDGDDRPESRKDPYEP